MNLEEKFKHYVQEKNKIFLAKIKEEPTSFIKIARDTVKRAEELQVLYPSDTQRYHEAAIEIVSVMGQGVGLIQLFTTAIVEDNLAAIAPGKFLDAVDALPAVDPVASNEIIITVAEKLRSLESAEYTFGDIFYQNYFGEYMANIFNVTCVEGLSAQPELFHQLKKLIPDPSAPLVLYEALGDANDLLKNDLADNYYSYEKLKMQLP